MLFKKILIALGAVLSVAACSDPPSENNQSSGSNSSSSGTPPTTTPLVPTEPDGERPVLRKLEYRIEGTIGAVAEDESYTVRVCSEKVCEEQKLANGVGDYSILVETEQWPLTKPVEIKVISDQLGVVSEQNYDSIKAMTEQDLNDDGSFTEDELPNIKVDAGSVSNQIVTTYVTQEVVADLSDSLSDISTYSSTSQTKVLTEKQKRNKALHHLADEYKHSVLELTAEQIKAIKAHVEAANPGASWRDYKTMGTPYQLSLNQEQWTHLKGNVETPDDQRILVVTLGQINTLYHAKSWQKPLDAKQIILSGNQISSIRGQVVWNKQVAVEVLALVDLIMQPLPDKLKLSTKQYSAITSEVKALNASLDLAKIETMPTNLPTEVIFDSEKEQETQLAAAGPVKIRASRQQIQAMFQAMIDDKSSAHLTLLTKQTLTRWPAKFEYTEQGKTIKIEGVPDLIRAILQAYKNAPQKSILEHYQVLLAKANLSLPYYDVLSSSATSQQQLMLEYRVKDIMNGNFKHRLKEAYLALSPTHSIKLSGRFPAELKQAELVVKLGSRPNPPDGDHYDTGEYPRRHEPVFIEDFSGKRVKNLNLHGKSDFLVTVELPDTLGTFESCKPGKRGLKWGDYTFDEMQDTLYIEIKDKQSKVVLRSVLGALCELAKLEETLATSNKNGIIEITELERLNVGYVSTAHSILLFRSTLNPDYGSSAFVIPLTFEQIGERIKGHPYKQVELLAGITRMQHIGKLFGLDFDLIESRDFYDDLMKLAGIDYFAQYRMVAKNSQLPTIEEIQQAMLYSAGFSAVLNYRLDSNISHVSLEATKLLADSNVDSYYFKTRSPGSWVAVYPVSIVSPTCSAAGILEETHIVGVGLAGKGKQEGRHWVSLNWLESHRGDNYQIKWRISGTDTFQTVDTDKPLGTITDLEFDQVYEIVIEGGQGHKSEPWFYSPSHIHVADTRIMAAYLNDDGNRGRDTDLSCDPHSGQPKNSKKDGLHGARYIKLDDKGQPLKRQDLHYRHAPFHCVMDSHTGLVWEMKRPEGKSQFTIFDNNNFYHYMTPEVSQDMSGTCVRGDINAPTSDPLLCNVENQTKWVNDAKLCGLTNWRLPKMSEFYGIADFGMQDHVGIDIDYFPNTSLPWTNRHKPDEIEHGFWTSDESIGELKARVFVPSMNLTAGYRPQNQPNMVWLVSDGFSSSEK